MTTTSSKQHDTARRPARTRPGGRPLTRGEDKATLHRVNLLELVQWFADKSALFAGSEDSPFVARVAPGSAKLVVVTGENAAGKSLLFRVLAAKSAAAGVRPVTLSIRERSGSGTAEMARFRQAMIFGDETDQSTGAGSVRAVTAAFGNLDCPQGSILGLDEPELGLSDGYAHALGQYIGAQAKSLPRTCSGVVLVTHSRPLVAGLAAAYGRRPTFVSTGAAGSASLREWLATPEVRSIEELLALPTVNLERFRWAQQFLQG